MSFAVIAYFSLYKGFTSYQKLIKRIDIKYQQSPSRNPKTKAIEYAVVSSSSVGKLRLRRRQLEKLGVEATKGLPACSRISPLLQKCCLCLSANESFSQSEQDLFLLTGMKIGHSTLQRQVYEEWWFVKTFKTRRNFFVARKS